VEGDAGNPSASALNPQSPMHKTPIAALLLAGVILAGPALAQTTVTLTATDSKSINPAGSNWNDNRFRAYYSSGIDYVDGFVKFDLSSIPDGASIVSMTLRAYHEAGFGNPFDNPEVQVYRVADDSWSRSNPADPHPGLNEVLTGIYTGFPSADLVPVDFILDVTAANWSVDLADDTLSLALRNMAGLVGRYSYVYFYGADAAPAPPELIVEYTSFTLSSSGTCGGTMTFRTAGFTPGGQVAFLYGFPGVFTWTGSPCTGTTVDIANPTIAQLSTATFLTTTVPAAACGRIRVQAVDVSTCSVSNYIDL